MAHEINEGYMPLWHEHDPRVPPFGRVVEAHVEETTDGELKLIGVVEEFERGDSIPYDPSRQMFMRSNADGRLHITFDRSYRDTRSLALIRDIAAILGTQPQPEAKKALEPLSILVLTGTFVAGGIASGFFKEVGSDGYKALKDKIRLALARRKAKKKPYLFRFSALVGLEDRTVEVDFLLTEPTTEALERLFHSHLAVADSMLIDYLRTQPEVQRVVFDASGPKLEFSYAVRSDCVPLFLRPHY
jgi:hypothetical protein